MTHAVTVNGCILQAALLHRQELALRGWLVARHADGQGSGVVSRERFHRCCRDLGFRRDAIRRMETRMVAAGWAASYRSRAGDPMIRITGQHALAERFRLRGKWSVQVEIPGLRDRSLRALFSSYHAAAIGESPRARQTNTSLTGVSAPTQRKGERKLGATVTPNYANLSVNSDQLERIPAIKPGQPTPRAGGRQFAQLPNSVSYDIRRVRRPHSGGLPDRGGRTNRRYFDEPQQAAKHPFWNGTASLTRGSTVRIAGQRATTWEFV
jgi:hypothetical protein